MGDSAIGTDRAATSPAVGTNQAILDGLPRCGTPMLFDAATPPEKRVYTCVAFPSSESQMTSRGSVSIFVNGVLNSEADSARSAAQLAQKLGRPVVRVHNNSERWKLPVILGFTFREYQLPGPDFLHAVMAKIAPAISSWVEPSVNVLRTTVAELLSRDRNVKVDIHAHSQGGIIVRGALDALRRNEFSGLPEREWGELSRRINVTTYGSAEHNMGIPSREFAHSLDVVPVVTSAIDYIRRLITDDRGDVERSEVTAFSHQFSDYLDDLPLFEAQALLREPYANPEEMTARLVEFERTGDYAREVSQGVIAEVIKKLPRGISQAVSHEILGE